MPTKQKLAEENALLKERLKYYQQQLANTPRRKPQINISLAADLWPPTDWFRLRLSPWQPGSYFQACVGPIRLDIFE